MTAPWWKVLGVEKGTAEALHFGAQSSAVAYVQKLFVERLKEISTRNIHGQLWALPSEFDDLVDAVHAAWLELGVSR